jgi:hypothetical protein
MRDEPLSFTAIPNVVGRNTLQVGIPGSPAFNWGLHGILQSRILGGTSNQYNATNDFTLVALDDPATYAALLAALDAATIANFTQYSDYDPRLLYLLFISRIRVADDDGTIFGAFYSNDLYNGTNLRAFLRLAHLDLRFNVEKGALPGQTKTPRTQICFDQRNQNIFKNIYRAESWEKLARGNGIQGARTGKLVVPTVKADKGKPPPNKASYCHEQGTWLSSEKGEGKGGTSTNVACVVNVQEKGARPMVADCSPRKDKKPADSSAYYVVYDKSSRKWLELKTRSTWGLYQQLGSLAGEIIDNNKPPLKLEKKDADSVILNLRKDYAGECFVEIRAKARYCVPEEPASKNTRIIFSLLRHLIGLQSAAVNVPVSTSSVRITP